MTPYQAIVTRESGVWLADVVDLPGAHTYARSLSELVAGAKEAIILMADLPDDAQVEVELTFTQAPVEVARAVVLGQARADLAQRGARVHADTSQVVHELRNAGYSVRDISVLLGMTPGRVSQLIHHERSA